MVPSSRLLGAGLVALGGVVGATLRYGVSLVLPGMAGTLAANVTGATALGVLLSWALVTGATGPHLRRFLGTGVLSSFTTYSTFAMETMRADPTLFGANILATYGFGFAGVLVGRAIADTLATREDA